MNETKENNHRMNLPRSSQRKTWLRGLLMLVIFLSGTIVGAGGTLLAVRQRVLHKIHHPQEVPAAVTARLRRKFDLSDKQAQQVETILRSRQGEILTLRRQFQPQLEGQLDKVASEIADVLDNQQRGRWEGYFRELRNTWLPAVPKNAQDDPSQEGF